MNDTTVKFIKIPEACERYGLGRVKLREVAGKAGAVIKVGKAVRIDYELMDKYMDEVLRENCKVKDRSVSEVHRECR